MTAIKISALSSASAIDPINDVIAVVDISADETRKVSINNVRKKPPYSWANLPDAATYQWQLIAINDNENSPLAYSDGTQWRYVSDGTLVRVEDIPAGNLIITTEAPIVGVDLPINIPVINLTLTTTAPTVV